MEMSVLVIYLLVFLKDCTGENADTKAIRNQQKPEVMINKLTPQQVYTIPTVTPNVNPLNLRLNNGLTNVPRVVVPVVTQQPNVISPGYPTVKVITPSPAKKPDILAVPVQTVPKIETTKTIIPEKTTKPKEGEFIEDAEDVKSLYKKEKTKEPRNELKIETAKKRENSQPADNKKQEQDLSKTTTIENKDVKAKPKEIKIEILPKVDTKIIEKGKQEPTESRKNDTANVVDDNALRTADDKDSVTYNIFKLINSEKYPNTPYIGPTVSTYTNNMDYLDNQPLSNVLIKNQDVEEISERAPDIMTSPYEFGPSNEQYNYQQPETYETCSNYYPNNPIDYGTLTKFQYQDANSDTGMPNSKDRVWRNWKSTEIYISNYENKFNNGYIRINGFNVPFMHGHVIGRDNRSPDTPLIYQCYIYPAYKQVY